MKEKLFDLHSDFSPTGDQPEAIKTLNKAQDKKSLLLGVTGSGKTFTLANVIADQNRQVLILSPNKTLAAQLFEEFKSFFPNNKVCYFVSYFDYYQPESYLPSSDTYIPKDSKINEEIERFRIEATASLINRPDTIIIASVSAIYSLGNPKDYQEMALSFFVGEKIEKRDFIKKLIAIQYERNDTSFESGSIRVVAEKIFINIPYLANNLMVEIDSGVISRICFIQKTEFNILSLVDNFSLLPAKHFVIPQSRIESAVNKISEDLNVRLEEIQDPLIKIRLKNRITHDITMLKNTGYCDGIENYSSYFDARNEQNRPFCLLDFFKKDFLMIIDESHIAIPQLNGMFLGDQSRKKNLVDYGFRLPSALQNRPLKFAEVETFFKNTIFVSATPGEYEKRNSLVVAEQIVRPTGVVDPVVSVVPREGQLNFLVKKIKEFSKKNYRSLVTVLTKKSAEELATFLEGKGINVCYMHSEIKTPKRTEILHKLRTGIFEVVVGINLLREGLDLPEVAFLAILDADIEGFLRNNKSLIQTIGRAARNIDSEVVLFADKMTDSMKEAINETNRRRKIQLEYNKKHNIQPRSASRKIADLAFSEEIIAKERPKRGSEEHKEVSIEKLKKQMMTAAKNKNFEKAIELRELIKKLEAKNN